MTFQHPNLASGRWQKLSFMTQMANIGSEVERAISWRKKRDLSYCRAAFERAWELLYLTIKDPKNKKRLKELCRLKEVLGDDFAGKNEYGSSDRLWHHYFYGFNHAASLEAGR